MLAFSSLSCQEPCLLCDTMQVRYTALFHFFKALCSLWTDFAHMSTCMRYMCAYMQWLNAQRGGGSGGGSAAGEGQGKVEQGAGQESKAADGVGPGKERCVVMSLECTLVWSFCS